MDIETRLRQLHTIQPDPAAARSSRVRILLAPQPQKLTIRGFITGALRSGSAMALTGLILFVLLGGFSIWKLVGPITGLDDSSLRAEAQAVDIQINLANLHYQDGAQGFITPNAALRASLVTQRPELPESTAVDATGATTTPPGGVTTTVVRVITVDDVLNILSK